MASVVGMLSWQDVADDQGLASAGGHDVNPLGRGALPFLQILEVPDVVHFDTVV